MKKRIPKYAISPININYITRGKIYPIINLKTNYSGDYGHGFNIKDNNNGYCFCLQNRCSHIYKNNWKLFHTKFGAKMYKLALGIINLFRK